MEYASSQEAVRRVIGLIPEGTMISIHGIDLIQEKETAGFPNGFKQISSRHAETSRVLPQRSSVNLDDLISGIMSSLTRH